MGAIETHQRREHEMEDGGVRRMVSGRQNETLPYEGLMSADGVFFKYIGCYL